MESGPCWANRPWSHITVIQCQQCMSGPSVSMTHCMRADCMSHEHTHTNITTPYDVSNPLAQEYASRGYVPDEDACLVCEQGKFKCCKGSASCSKCALGYHADPASTACWGCLPGVCVCACVCVCASVRVHSSDSYVHITLSDEHIHTQWHMDAGQMIDVSYGQAQCYNCK